jgi:hypothetical protein
MVLPLARDEYKVNASADGEDATRRFLSTIMRAFAAASDAYEFARNDSSRARPFLVWLIVAALACSLLCLIILAPLASLTKDFFALSIYHGFGLVCHQLPARSFFIENYPLAVRPLCGTLRRICDEHARVSSGARCAEDACAAARVAHPCGNAAGD